MHTLRLLEGTGAPQTFVLGTRVTTLGRAAANDIVLDGPKVSKRHALVSIRADDSVLVEDLNSRNGVYVEERRVLEQVLKPGTALRIGDCRLLYEKAESRHSDSLPGTAGMETGYRLLIADGQGSFETVPLKTECLYLGKVEDNDVVLPGADVSRRHAMLCYHAGRWQIHDLESTNGTRVRGQGVEQAEVAPGERIRIGRFLLAIEGPDRPVSREALQAEAVRELRHPASYMAWTTQVKVLIFLLVASVLLGLIVVLRVRGGG